MQPDNQQAPGTGDWVSREEYERLRDTVAQQQEQTNEQAIQISNDTTRAQRRWQIILGALLSIGFYFSVSSGSFSNWFVIGAILIFAGVSVYDHMHTQKVQIGDSLVDEPAFRKHNPYKILTIIMLCIAIVPALAFIGLILLFFTMGGLSGGGHMGS